MTIVPKQQRDEVESVGLLRQKRNMLFDQE